MKSDHRVLWVGLGIVAALIGLSIVVPVLSPWAITDQDLDMRLLAPRPLAIGEPHPLGTDDLGRDIATRLFFGMRVTLLVATVGTVLNMVVGSALGLFAGFFRGILDGVVSFLVDLQLAVPLTLVALVGASVLGPGVVSLIVVIGIVGWEPYARISRSVALSVSQTGFVEAAKASGTPNHMIILAHLAPQTSSHILAFSTINFARIVFVESTLSFLGVGIQGPTVSLGSLVSLGRDYLLTAWWISGLPALAIVIIVLPITLIGDWLRDHVDK